MKATWSAAAVLAIARSAPVRTESSFSPPSSAFCQSAWMKSWSLSRRTSGVGSSRTTAAASTRWISVVPMPAAARAAGPAGGLPEGSAEAMP